MNLISFQNVSEHEKIHPGPLAQHIHNKKDLETRTTASSPSLQLTGQQKTSRGEFLLPDYQIHFCYQTQTLGHNSLS